MILIQVPPEEVSVTFKAKEARCVSCANLERNPARCSIASSVLSTELLKQCEQEAWFKESTNTQVAQR